MDAAGNLYGTTYGTGPYMYSYGTVFKLTNSGGQWNETDLYAFTDGDDGSFPQSNVVSIQVAICTELRLKAEPIAMVSSGR